jgi:chaperone required for assembly of F1-ATPase
VKATEAKVRSDEVKRRHAQEALEREAQEERETAGAVEALATKYRTQALDKIKESVGFGRYKAEVAYTSEPGQKRANVDGRAIATVCSEMLGLGYAVSRSGYLVRVEWDAPRPAEDREDWSVR